MTPSAARRDRVVGIVLAGGAGRRFGSDKLAADLDHRPILDHAVEAVAQVADAVLVAGRSAGTWEVVGGGRRIPARAIPDPVEAGGPLVGLAVGLASAEAGDATVAVVIGGDMPRVPAAVLDRLLEHLRLDDADAVVLLEGEARRPLPLAVRVAPARPVVAGCLAEGRVSLLAPLDRLAVLALREEEWRVLDPRGDALLDVDRPGDLEAARRA